MLQKEITHLKSNFCQAQLGGKIVLFWYFGKYVNRYIKIFTENESNYR